MHLVPKHVEQTQIALDEVGIVLVRPSTAVRCGVQAQPQTGSAKAFQILGLPADCLQCPTVEEPGSWTKRSDQLVSRTCSHRPLYQSLVLTAADSLGTETIRIQPEDQTLYIHSCTALVRLVRLLPLMCWRNSATSGYCSGKIVASLDSILSESFCAAEHWARLDPQNRGRLSIQKQFPLRTF